VLQVLDVAMLRCAIERHRAPPTARVRHTTAVNTRRCTKVDTDMVWELSE